MKMVMRRRDDWFESNTLAAGCISGTRMNEVFKSLYLDAVGNGLNLATSKWLQMVFVIVFFIFEQKLAASDWFAV